MQQRHELYAMEILRSMDIRQAYYDTVGGGCTQEMLGLASDFVEALSSLRIDAMLPSFRSV